MANEGIGVVVGLSARPDSLDEFVALAQEKMVRPTQAAPGCLRYELWQDLDQPDKFVIIEEWESEEAHAAHLASGWLEPVIAELQPFAAGAFDMQRISKTQ
jgi:quinol monooxygenase YgiN